MVLNLCDLNENRNGLTIFIEFSISDFMKIICPVVLELFHEYRLMDGT
jgi:hypothetical protein